MKKEGRADHAGKPTSRQATIPETLLAARIPNLLLQPLVENAPNTGSSPNSGAGRSS